VGSATADDDLRLAGNGGSLTVIDAAVYWDGSRVGTIDNTKDGQDGSALRIDFSTVAPLANAGFETGDLTGWTVDYTKDQMQGQSWAEGHVYPGGTHDATPLVDDGTTTTLTAEVVVGAAQAGSYGLRIAITGSVAVGYGTSHGPSVTSSAFFAQSGDSLSLFWQANQDGDYYDVFGFVFKDANDNASWDTGETYQKLFHGTAATTSGWIETTATLDFGSNDLRFWFINGNWDASGGMAIGSSLYIDGITLNIAQHRNRDQRDARGHPREYSVSKRFHCRSGNGKDLHGRHAGLCQQRGNRKRLHHPAIGKTHRIQRQLVTAGRTDRAG